MVLRIASLLLALAAAPALLAHAGDVTCKYSDSETCPVESLTPDTDDGSVLVYPGGNTRCAFDDYTDSKTTFSTNATYFFQVFPNEALDKSKVMLYFQGGGACTDKYTCNFGVQCALGSSPLFTSVATASSAGVLNRSMEENMFKDWNIIHIPYCTGDLHVGDKTTASYTTGYEVALGNSQCLGQNKSMHMNGYNNAQSALQWALANYPEPEHLVLAGYSAGSLSAQLYSSYVANLWEVESKDIKYQVLADSYVGVFPEDETPSSVLLDYFGACDVDLDVAENVTAACKAETLKTVELVSSLLERVPFSDWLFIDSKGDKTQRKFYELVKDGIAGYPFTNLISEADFYSNMTAILDAYENISSKITTFNVDSTMHVYLRESNFTDYVSDTGAMLGDVLTEWLGSDETPAPTATATSTPSTTGTAAPTTTFPAATATAAPSTTTATPSSSSSSSSSSSMSTSASSTSSSSSTASSASIGSSSTSSSTASSGSSAASTPASSSGSSPDFTSAPSTGSSSTSTETPSVSNQTSGTSSAPGEVPAVTTSTPAITTAAPKAC